MCLTPEAFALFLNLIGASIVTSTPGEVTVHASTRDVIWVETDEHWCTNGPAIDRKARFE